MTDFTLLVDGKNEKEHRLATHESLQATRVIKSQPVSLALGIQVPSQKVIGDYLCRLGGPKYLLRFGTTGCLGIVSMRHFPGQLIGSLAQSLLSLHQFRVNAHLVSQQSLLASLGAYSPANEHGTPKPLGCRGKSLPRVNSQVLCTCSGLPNWRTLACPAPITSAGWDAPQTHPPPLRP